LNCLDFSTHSLLLSKPLYKLAGIIVTITKYHRLDGLNNWHLYSHFS
jgi:hypothetical protein